MYYYFFQKFERTKNKISIVFKVKKNQCIRTRNVFLSQVRNPTEESLLEQTLFSECFKFETIVN